MNKLNVVQECLVRMVVELWRIQVDLEIFQAECKDCNNGIRSMIRLKCIDHKITAIEKWMDETKSDADIKSSAKKTDACQTVLNSLLQKDLLSIYNIAMLTKRLEISIAFVGERIKANNIDGTLSGLTKTHEHVADNARQSKKCLTLQNMLFAMS